LIESRPVKEETRVILFRSIRNVLIKGTKRARAHPVRVRLNTGEDQPDAEVEDYGIGMTTDIGKFKGSRPSSIRERLGHVGRGMRIDSEPGQGMRIPLCAPIQRAEPMKKEVGS
jgi:signal transduction histidine kinase